MRNFKIVTSLFLVLCWLLSAGGFAQSHDVFHPDRNANIYVQYLAEKQPDKNVHVLVQGDEELIRGFINSHSGHYKYKVKGYVNCILKAKHLVELNGKPFVDRVEVNAGRGEVLTDQSVVNVNAHKVRQGLPPLPKGYTGKNVLLGFIDTGIDFTHPDFQDSLGNTRILHLWDQSKSYDAALTPAKYGYGQEWDSTAINNGNSTHMDPYSYYGHGTNVAGVAGGNGLSVPDSVEDFRGVAPESNMIVVATDFSAGNWTMTVADAVDYIFAKGEQYNMPVVINASLGTYAGSHDGEDLAAQLIDSLVKEKRGRAMVCAVGNSGDHEPYHLGYQVNSDTNYTWFEVHPNSTAGSNAVFYEIWADTSDFDQVHFAFGATDTATLNEVGVTAFDQVQNRLNIVVTDSIVSANSTLVTQVHTWGEIRGGRYFLQVYIPNPPKSNYYGFYTTGQGSFDTWSSENFGYSRMVSGISQPHYKSPDSLQSMVSSWACLPSVITVANYVNRNTYTDIDGNTQTLPETAGSHAVSSSKGPTRSGLLKPDVAAPGSYTLAAGLAQDLNALSNSPSVRHYLAQGGYHRRAGGSSMASPVVAGIAALYLEKCPNATYAEIISAIQNTAFSDSLTGSNLPDYAWGRGKVDAFSVLLQSNYKPGILSSDSLLCPDGTVNLSTSGFETYSWSTGDTGSAIAVDSAGAYTLQVTNNSGCVSQHDTVDVQPGTKPNVQLRSDTLLCGNGQVQVSVDSSFQSVLWSDQSSGYQRMSAGDSVIWVRVENQVGCEGSDTVNIGYIPLPPLELGPSKSICEGDSVRLKAPSGNYTYQWNSGSTDSAIYVSDDTLYHVTVTDSAGCHIADSVEVILNPRPVVNLQDMEYCSGTNVLSLAVGPPGMSQYQWSNGYSGQVLHICNHAPSGCNYLINEPRDTLWLKATNAFGCHNTDTLHIEFHPSPSVDLGDDTAFCTNTDFSMVYDLSDSSYTSIEWSDGSQDSIFVQQYFGTTMVYVEDQQGCEARDTVLVDSLETPQFDLGPDSSFLNVATKSLKIEVPHNLGNYQWFNGETTNVLGLKAKAHGVDTIWLSVTNHLGCSFSDTALYFYGSNSIPETRDGRFSVFPNPANQVVNIRSSLPETHSVAIIDSRGRHVLQKQLATGKARLDIRKLVAGTYTIMIKSNDNFIYQQPLIVQ